MTEYWIVSINIPYYPWIEVFDDEAKAKKRYEEAVRENAPSEEYGGSVYLAKVLAHVTKHGIENEVDLRRRLEEHGYTLYGIRHFKNHDRINFGNDNIKISLNLRSKISYLALDAIVEACVGKKAIEERK